MGPAFVLEGKGWSYLLSPHHTEGDLKVKYTKLPRRSICLGITLLACVSGAFAQQAAMATNPSAKPFFQSVTLGAGQKKQMDFSVRAVGSVKGRVFNDAESGVASESTDSEGIAGVKVTLRSRDKGFENYVLEQFTDETGSYAFYDLRPGKYAIEIDPIDLPAKLRSQAANEEPVEVEPSQSSVVHIAVTPQRAITGIVFVDNDGDAMYKVGKDDPVGGALITVGGSLAVTAPDGTYTLRDLPGGRIGLLVHSPAKAENTHVVLDLGTGPVTNRVVNIPVGR